MAKDTGLSDLKQDLRTSMTIAAFTGISWFIGAEINTSLLYIWHSRKYLRSSSLLVQRNLKSTSGGSSSTLSAPVSATKQVLLHLVSANILVITPDIALLGVQYPGLFYLQDAFKPCVYGVKLKVEFAINRLVETVRMRMCGRQQGAGSYYQEGSSRRGGAELVSATGGRPRTKSGAPAQPQIQVSDWEDEWPEETGRVEFEQIGLGTLDHQVGDGTVGVA